MSPQVHFPVPSNCPFCPENGMVDIISESNFAYLVEAKGSPVPGCFLIIPYNHIENVTQLPGLWQTSVTSLLQDVPWFTQDTSLNLSFNLGRDAGQTLSHLHLWVIPRDGEDPESPGFQKGMATLLQNASAPAPV